MSGILYSFRMYVSIFSYQIHKTVGRGNTTGYWCVLRWESDVIGRIYGVYMFLVVLVIPLVLMTVAYTCICRRVWMLHSETPHINLQM